MRNIALIELLKGNDVYYLPNRGNGGDALIASGTFQFFDENNIQYEIINNETDLTNKIVVYGGGGNLVSNYTATAEFISKWHKKVKKLIVLPHTINGHSDLLANLKDNVHIFCREDNSYKYVSKSAINANVHNGEDMALSLDFVDCMRKYSTIYPYKCFLKQLIKKIRRLDNPITYRTLNAFRCDVEKTEVQLPKDNIDVSTMINYTCSMTEPHLVNQTTADFFKFLSFYKTINTNRLHVGIAATLLGKNVNFHPNSYYKNEAVYERSLKHFPNINLIK